MATAKDLLQEIIDPVVKLELMPSYADDGPDHGNQSASIEEIKIGEIFRVKDHFKFFCVHCAAEFPLFSLFTVHCESHLQEIVSKSIVAKPNNISDTLNPETEIKTEDDFEYINIDDIQPDCILDSSSEAPSVDKKLRQKKRRTTKKDVAKKRAATNKSTVQNDSQPECYLCRATFSRAADLKNHFRKKHVKKIPYKDYKYSRTSKCKICGEQFDNVPSFEKHIRWHKKELNHRPHKCDECGNSFIERFQLERHKKLHKKKNVTCEICHKSYNERYIDGHLRRHTGQYRVQCTDCGRFYSSKDKLKTHMLTHTGENPFECEYCHKRFRQSYSLTIHKRSHTGEYIHYCTPCKKGFGYRRELRKHNLRVHGIETVEESDPKLKESVEENVQQ